MDFELCKKLKDAGFPMPIDNCEFIRSDHKQGNEEIGIPSLSELIEACGDGFTVLTYMFTTDGKIWIADNASGSTPEIAVANLWLELNGKE